METKNQGLKFRKNKRLKPRHFSETHLWRPYTEDREQAKSDRACRTSCRQGNAKTTHTGQASKPGHQVHSPPTQHSSQGTRWQGSQGAKGTARRASDRAWQPRTQHTQGTVGRTARQGTHHASDERCDSMHHLHMV